MNINFLLEGFIVGLAVSLPVGPTSVLCIHRALAKGFLSGIVSSLGAATGQVVYAYIGAFGLMFISSTLVSQQVWLLLITGVFLCYLGLKTFLDKPTVSVKKTDLQGVWVKEKGFVSDYVSMFILTLANPMTILPFAAIFTEMGMTNEVPHNSSRELFVLGVFISGAFWYSLLSGASSSFRVKFSPDVLQWVNKISGVMIIGFGLLVLKSLIEKIFVS